MKVEIAPSFPCQCAGLCGNHRQLCQNNAPLGPGVSVGANGFYCPICTQGLTTEAGGNQLIALFLVRRGSANVENSHEELIWRGCATLPPDASDAEALEVLREIAKRSVDGIAEIQYPLTEPGWQAARPEGVLFGESGTAAPPEPIPRDHGCLNSWAPSWKQTALLVLSALLAHKRATASAAALLLVPGAVGVVLGLPLTCAIIARPSWFDVALAVEARAWFDLGSWVAAVFTATAFTIKVALEMRTARALRRLLDDPESRPLEWPGVVRLKNAYEPINDSDGGFHVDTFHAEAVARTLTRVERLFCRLYWGW